MSWSDQLWMDYAYLSEIRNRYGSPLYLFRPSVLAGKCRQLREIAGCGETWRPYYMAKANWLPEVLKLVSAADIGVTVSSEVELALARGAEVDPERIVVVGPAKPDRFLLRCIRDNVNMVMLESQEEALVLDDLARKERATVRVGCRCSVDLEAHRRSRLFSRRGGGRTSKFGWSGREVVGACRAIGELRGLQLCAVSTNLGSQICRPVVYSQALEELQAVANDLRTKGICLPQLRAPMVSRTTHEKTS